jgi:hypothetical protein
MNNQMNAIALNQTVFKNFFVFGGGVSGSNQDYATESLNGWYVFVNGKTSIPECDPIEEIYELGEMYYPDMMPGMPSAGGHIVYKYAVTEHEFLIIIGVKLDDFAFGESDYAEDIAVLMFKDRLVKNATAREVVKELMMAHLTVFLGEENPQEIVDRLEFDDDPRYPLKEIIEEYVLKIEEQKLNPKPPEEIPRELKEIIEVMKSKAKTREEGMKEQTRKSLEMIKKLVKEKYGDD